MYLALASGLNPDESMEMAAHLASHPVLEAKINTARHMLSQGESFCDALLQNQIFDSLSTRMLSIGFRTGSSEEVMKQISIRYEEEINDRICGIIEKLEPTLVAIMAVIVGMILLSVMLPLIGIMSGIG